MDCSFVFQPLIIYPFPMNANLFAIYFLGQVRISVAGANTMLISWITDNRTAPTVVEYGTSPGKYTASETGYSTNYQILSCNSGAIHNVTIGPLEPTTTYYYRCGVTGNELSLRTPPSSLPIQFVIIGRVLVSSIQ